MPNENDPYGIREGEIALPFDPGADADDARLVFIGRIRSPWMRREDCPKNLRQARERGKPATVEIDVPWRQGLLGLEGTSHLILLYWMDRARRDLIVQTPAQYDRANRRVRAQQPRAPQSDRARRGEAAGARCRRPDASRSTPSTASTARRSST